MALHPEIDILWLHFAASSEHADELGEDYGRQLDHFKNVIVEEMGIGLTWMKLWRPWNLSGTFRSSMYGSKLIGTTMMISHCAQGSNYRNEQENFKKGIDRHSQDETGLLII
jgi:hypothetical protein